MGKRVVVVGGVAGGASAAAKAKRENPELEVVVYEKSGWVSYGACGLPYVLSGEIPFWPAPRRSSASRGSWSTPGTRWWT
jgi:NADPH-dependent 2,4-dienoyl-CoA reductase/sulfur reductase-like enzyme